MDGQITIEEMQAIIGRLTMNYELQLSRFMKENTRLMSEVTSLKETISKKQSVK